MWVCVTDLPGGLSPYLNSPGFPDFLFPFQKKKKGRHYSRVCGVVFSPLYFSDICFLEKQWDQRDVIPAGEGCLRKAKIMDGSGKVYLKVMEGPLCLLLVMERKHTYVKIWLCAQNDLTAKAVINKTRCKLDLNSEILTHLSLEI